MMQQMTVADLKRVLADIDDDTLPVVLHVQEKGSHFLMANGLDVRVTHVAGTRPNGQRWDRGEVLIEGRYFIELDPGRQP